MKILITLVFILFGLYAQAQQALNTFNAEMARIESLSSEADKSDARGKALAVYFDTRVTEAGKQTAINETNPYLRKLLDYDFRAAFRFVMKVNDLADAKMFIQNHMSSQEGALVKALAANITSNTAIPANVPQYGYGFKGKWNNTSSIAANTTSSAIDNGNIELKKGFTALDVKNYSEAHKWFKIAAEKGNKDAFFQIGVLYFYGNGVTQSNQESLKWFQQSLNKGNSSAEILIGAVYTKLMQFENAFQAYRNAALKGHAEAMHLLGLMYYNGQGTAKNTSEARAWLQKSANMGYEKSKVALQEIIKSTENGKEEFDYAGKEMEAKNYAEALKLYKIAASKGSTEAALMAEVLESNMRSLLIEKEEGKQPVAFKGDNGKFGFKDQNGKIIAAPIYIDVKKFSEGMAPVCIKDGDNKKWGYIDLSGKEVIPIKYGDALPFSEGLAAVRPEGKTWNAFYGFIDKTGKLIIPHEYPFVFDLDLAYEGWMFINGKAKVYNKENKLIYIDKAGKEVKQ
jgi:TPR repeat protein